MRRCVSCGWDGSGRCLCGACAPVLPGLRRCSAQIVHTVRNVYGLTWYCLWSRLARCRIFCFMDRQEQGRPPPSWQSLGSCMGTCNFRFLFF